MITRKSLFAAAVACAVTGGAMGAALAQPGPGGPGGWHHGGGLLDGITLTDDQKSKLHALMEAGHADMKALHGQLQSIHEKIDATLLSSGTVSEATLAPLVQQKEMLMQQLDAKEIGDEIAIRNLLTADQIAKASATHAKLVALHEQERALHADDAPPDHPE